MPSATTKTSRSTPTIRQALTLARTTLAQSDSPALDAQILLCHILKLDRAYLFAHAEQTLHNRQYQAFQSLLKRRAAGEPIAYITGSIGFYDLELSVSPAVLIPRPETELLLEEALRLTANTPACTAADIGTGSGALALAFARHRPRATVYATDICQDALKVARINAKHNQIPVHFLHGNLARPLLDRNIKIDLLLANLPYIPSHQLEHLAVNRFEPSLALDGGADGLALIRQLLDQIPSLCNNGAQILLEIGADQAEAVRALIQQRLDLACAILQDYAGWDRIARFQLP